MNTTKQRSLWSWIPSLYFAEGIPYIIVMFVASDMYKTLGISNAVLAFWTGLLYLPWVIKPLWSPFVDMVSTKRNWIFWMQLALAVMFIGVSISLHLPWWFPMTIFFLWGMAFSSSTHDIAADGFYILALNEHDQAFFTGIRSTFYRLAMIAGLGLLGIITGVIIDNTGLGSVDVNVKAVQLVEASTPVTMDDIPVPGNTDDDPRILIYPPDLNIAYAGQNAVDTANVYFVLSSAPEEPVVMAFGQKKGSQDITLITSGVVEFNADNWNQPQRQTLKVGSNLREPADAVFVASAGDIPFGWSVSLAFLGGLFVLFALYHRFVLPHPVRDGGVGEEERESYVEILVSFFRKDGIVPTLLFLLFYRFSEAQLTKMASPFLLDARENGGLALSLTEKSFAYGTVGLIALLAGGILGGFLASRHGLKKWIWWMALSINLPNIVYVLMSYGMPSNLFVINSAIAIEQFGYGFGFTGYMLYMLYVAQQGGKHETAHFALTTGFMALGMMIPGMISGYIQELMGYQHFFIYVIVCTIPSFLALYFIKIDPGFGIKKTESAKG